MIVPVKSFSKRRRRMLSTEEFKLLAVNYQDMIFRTAESGTQIGTVGSIGMAAGPHLHLELWQNDTPLDPLQYLNGSC